jgi:hypothetical protein
MRTAALEKPRVRDAIRRLVATVLFGLIVPAVTAAFSGVFFQKNLEATLQRSEKGKNVVAKLENFKSEQDRLRTLIQKIEHTIEHSDTSEKTLRDLHSLKVEY